MSNALQGFGAMTIGLGSPRNSMTPISSTPVHVMPAFQIDSTKGIPEKALIRTEDTGRHRLDSLMRVPNHKAGTTKFDSMTDARTIAPLTSEDIGQFNNLGLMSTLRSQQPSVTNGMRNKSVTVDNPPSFYDDDLKKKMDKYSKSIKERHQFKR